MKKFLKSIHKQIPGKKIRKKTGGIPKTYRESISEKKLEGISETALAEISEGSEEKFLIF